LGFISQQFSIVRITIDRGLGIDAICEDPLTQDLIAVKFIHPAVTLTSEFLRQIDGLIQLTHSCVLRIVGYCFTTPKCPARIGTKFAAGESLPEAPPRLGDTEKAIVIIGIVLGMKFIHSCGVVHRDLKPANILLDERGHPKIGDLGGTRFCDFRKMMTSGVGTLLYMAPEMYEAVDYTAAVDVYSFVLIAYEVFVGKPTFSPTLSLAVLRRRSSRGPSRRCPSQ
jgi:serine/threonine-protein kinase